MSRKVSIAFSGCDGTGKSTQVRLLSEVLRPNRVIKSPNYGHWSGKIFQAFLEQQTLRLSSTQGSFPVESKTLTPLQAALLNGIGFDASLQSPPADHHSILDRWTLDTVAFGRAQGLDGWFLDSLAQIFPTPDMTFILVGSSFDQPEDIYERNQSLQDAVIQEFIQGADRLGPSRSMLVYTDTCRRPEDRIFSIYHMHQQIVATLNSRLGLSLSPLTQDRINLLLHPVGTSVSAQPILPFDPTDLEIVSAA